MKKLFILVSLAFLFSSCSGVERTLKTIGSDFGGGLERIATVYTYDGKPIKTWEGKIDFQSSDVAGKVLFDLNGKRVIINGGIVISEER